MRMLVVFDGNKGDNDEMSGDVDFGQRTYPQYVIGNVTKWTDDVDK